MAGRRIWIGTLTVNGKVVKQVKSSDKKTTCLVIGHELESLYGINTMFSGGYDEGYSWKSTSLEDKVELDVKYKHQANISTDEW